MSNCEKKKKKSGLCIGQILTGSHVTNILYIYILNICIYIENSINLFQFVALYHSTSSTFNLEKVERGCGWVKNLS